MMPTQYASFAKRFVAHVIDAVLAAICGGLVAIPFALITTGRNMTGLFSFLAELDSVPPLEPGEILTVLSWAVLFNALYWLYFAVFESSHRQATPGKMIFGLFVTDAKGGRISFPRALARTMSKVLSQMFLYIGYLMALFTPRKQALHDLIAGTLVLEPAQTTPRVEQAARPYQSTGTDAESTPAAEPESDNQSGQERE